MEVANNKRALFDYEVLEKLEAGLQLTGPEVKAAKARRVQLTGAYVTLRSKGPQIVNMHIAPYAPAAAVQQNYSPTRTRNLLITKKEIDYLTGKSHEAGLTILPIRVYTKRGFLKIELGLCKGKKKRDKRASIKKREQTRKIQKGKLSEM